MMESRHPSVRSLLYSWPTSYRPSSATLITPSTTEDSSDDRFRNATCDTSTDTAHRLTPPVHSEVALTSLEHQLEQNLIETLRALRNVRRSDRRDRATLEANFRRHFEALNRVTLTDGEFKRLLDEIITPDVFTASRALREINTFTRDDCTPLFCTLINIKD